MVASPIAAAEAPPAVRQSMAVLNSVKTTP
jgi:hypothetical protein